MDDISRRSSEVGTMAGFVRVRGAREHNPKDVSVDFHRHIGLWKVLARLRDPLCRGPAALPRIRIALCPALISSDGSASSRHYRWIAPAVALQQQRGSPTTRSS